MIFLTQPSGFVSKVTVTGCFILSNDTILLLQRAADSLHGNLWGIPAGKMEKNETPENAVHREVWEETGIHIPKNLSERMTVYAIHPEKSFTYVMFSYKLSEKPEVSLREREHQGYTWVSVKKAITMPLVPDQDTCTRLFFHLAE